MQKNVFLKTFLLLILHFLMISWPLKISEICPQILFFASVVTSMIYFQSSVYQSYSRIKIYNTFTFPSIISTLSVFISPSFVDYPSKTFTSLPYALVNLLFRDFITFNYTKFLLVFSLSVLTQLDFPSLFPVIIHISL